MTRPPELALTLLLALLAAALGGCTLASPDPVASTAPADGGTILLVSLDDGTIVRQSVDLGAEVCMKAAANAATTCLSRGQPVFNDSGTLVGYEMRSEVIELHAAE